MSSASPENASASSSLSTNMQAEYSSSPVSTQVIPTLSSDAAEDSEVVLPFPTEDLAQLVVAHLYDPNSGHVFSKSVRHVEITLRQGRLDVTYRNGGPRGYSVPRNAEMKAPMKSVLSVESITVFDGQEVVYEHVKSDVFIYTMPRDRSLHIHVS